MEVSCYLKLKHIVVIASLVETSYMNIVIVAIVLGLAVTGFYSQI